MSQISESFQLSPSDPIIIARELNKTQPDQKLATAESRKILARFLEDENDEAALREAKEFLKDKVLT